MASAPQSSRLPVLYKDLVPLSSKEHASWKTRAMNDANFIANQHAIPLTAEEFPNAQRDYPIVFSSTEQPVPLALMGLNEGVNVYIDADGKVTDNIYLPAYIRRYPFMLARLQPDRDELSLCFDPSAGLVGDFDEGNPLFDGEEPSENTKGILGFCEQFERAVQNTSAFVNELKRLDLLMDGELKIENPNMAKPFLYQGFKMVNEEKLRDLRGDELRKMSQSGMLPLLYAHLFSLQGMRDLFARQAAMGKLPQGTDQPVVPPVVSAGDMQIN